MVSLWFLHHKKLLVGGDFGGGTGMFAYMVAELHCRLTFDATGFHHNIKGCEADIVGQISTPAIGQLDPSGKMLLDAQNSRHVEPIAVHNRFGQRVNPSLSIKGNRTLTKGNRITRVMTQATPLLGLGQAEISEKEV